MELGYIHTSRSEDGFLKWTWEGGKLIGVSVELAEATKNVILEGELMYVGPFTLRVLYLDNMSQVYRCELLSVTSYTLDLDREGT